MVSFVSFSSLWLFLYRLNVFHAVGESAANYHFIYDVGRDNLPKLLSRNFRSKVFPSDIRKTLKNPDRFFLLFVHSVLRVFISFPGRRLVPWMNDFFLSLLLLLLRRHRRRLSEFV